MEFKIRQMFNLALLVPYNNLDNLLLSVSDRYMLSTRQLSPPLAFNLKSHDSLSVLSSSHVMNVMLCAVVIIHEIVHFSDWTMMS